ncbi:MAG: hypothetical protein RL173_638 [Fibrobacterota bacterium]
MFYNGRVNLLAALLLWAIPSKSINWKPDSAGRMNCELWLDAYYTAFNVSRSMTDAPIAKLVSDGERATDWWLFTHLWQPRDVLVETSVNPLPVGGWATRKWAKGTYEDATLNGANLVQAFTQGFPEPWAVSLFLGNVVQLVSATDTVKVNGMGYSGFLLTWGAWNLADNRLIRDNWLEAEVKIKGDDIRSTRKMGWSFRAGVREHFNPEIRDAFYVSIVRKRTDFRYSGWYPLRNSSLELRADVDQTKLIHLEALEFLRWSVVVGKKFPFNEGKMAWSVSTGVVHELHPGYTGSLRTKAPRGWRLVLQPNLEW